MTQNDMKTPFFFRCAGQNDACSKVNFAAVQRTPSRGFSPAPRTFRPQEQTDRILLCAIAHELHMHGLYSTASSRAVRRPYTQGSPRGTNVSSRFRKRQFADSFTRSHNSISSGHSSSSESSVVDVVGDVLDVLEPVPASTPSAPSPRVSNSCGHS